MRGLMACSRDGYLCKGVDDDMTWTGKIDKALFKLLTVGQRHPVLAGRTTYEQMPNLRDRKLCPLSRFIDGPHVSLKDANEYWPDAWVIGGPTVMRVALDEGYITHLHLVCVPHVLGGGVPVTALGPYVIRWPDQVIEIPPVKVRIWRFDGKV